jgi:hypothetical protein
MARKKTKKPSMKRKKIQNARSQKELGFLNLLTIKKTIEEILGSYWQSMSTFCEEVTVFLLSLKLKKDMIIVFIPEEKRDKNLPVRYIVSHKDSPGILLRCG